MTGLLRHRADELLEIVQGDLEAPFHPRVSNFTLLYRVRIRHRDDPWREWNMTDRSPTWARRLDDCSPSFCAPTPGSGRAVLRKWHHVLVSARDHADRWLAAWNERDLDRIIGCYSEDVDFVAPTVVRRWGRPDGALRGRQELRQHFARGLELASKIRFSEEALLQTPGGYALLYRRENGNRVLDVVELDSEGLATRVRAYYEFDQA